MRECRERRREYAVKRPRELRELLSRHTRLSQRRRDGRALVCESLLHASNTGLKGLQRRVGLLLQILLLKELLLLLLLQVREGGDVASTGGSAWAAKRQRSAAAAVAAERRPAVQRERERVRSKRRLPLPLDRAWGWPRYVLLWFERVLVQQRDDTTGAAASTATDSGG